MSPEEDRFVRDFGEAVSSGSAALFVGAGMSIAAGYPSWRALLKDIAAELNLSPDEPDLVALAQYHINENTGNTAGLVLELQRSLGDDKPLTPAHHLMTRLPIDVVWTTNYDRMVERAFRENGKRPDVKYTQSQLSAFDRRGDVTVFKMHGSIDDPSDIVIAREHYELYGSRRELFRRLLLTDLLRRTFLFVGLSFTDPNLLNIFGLLRATLRENTPRHWAVMLPPKVDEGQDEALVARRHELFVRDLRRYGLTVLTMENADHLVSLLAKLELHVARRSVLVSGSYPLEQQDETSFKIRAVSRLVGATLAELQLVLVSGFGTTVGSETIAGFLEQSYENAEAPSARMNLRPFPRGQSDEFVEQYRRDMVSQAGVVVVIGGVRDGGIAPGVMAEVALARDRGRPIVPIGATGGAAAMLWKEMCDAGTPFDSAAFATLGDSHAAPDAIATAFRNVISAVTA